MPGASGQVTPDLALDDVHVWHAAEGEAVQEDELTGALPPPHGHPGADQPVIRTEETVGPVNTANSD